MTIEEKINKHCHTLTLVVIWPIIQFKPLEMDIISLKNVKCGYF